MRLRGPARVDGCTRQAKRNRPRKAPGAGAAQGLAGAAHLRTRGNQAQVKLSAEIGQGGRGAREQGLRARSQREVGEIRFAEALQAPLNWGASSIG